MKYFYFLSILFISISVFSQQTDYVDFKTTQADISIQPKQKSVNGHVTYTFDILKPTDSIFIDAQNMDFKQVLFNGDSINWHTDGKKNWIVNTFKPSKGNQLSFDYKAHPKKALYFIDWDTSTALSVN